MTVKVDTTSPIAARAAELGLTLVSRAGTDRAGQVAPTRSVDSMRMTGEAAELKAMEKGLDKEDAAFNAQKVAAIREALASGTYQIDPQNIASRILESEKELQQ